MAEEGTELPIPRNEDHTRLTNPWSQDLPPFPSMDDGPKMNNGLPVVLRRRHRWVSRQTERQIEEAWGPSGPQRTCQVCYEELPSHQALRLHVNAHFLLHFCPCGFHDVYPYPVIAHRVDCFAGEGHVVDADNYTQYLEAIKPMIKRASTWAASSSGFYTLLTAARQKSPMVKNAAAIIPRPDSTPSEVTDPPEEETPAPAGLNQLATVEERLLRLQEELTQLAPDLLSTTIGLNELKGSVRRLKRRLRARQARHRIQSLQN